MRADLLALTPEAVATLSNLGLVKRARREIEAGAGPALAEADDGTVAGTFPDGVVARLPAGRALKDGACSCGAVSLCRHRVSVALAYRGWAGAADTARTGESGWSPGETTDEALLATLGKRTLQRARDLVRRACDVEVCRPDAGPPSARLPTCSVAFLVPRDLNYARCDCTVALHCEHVAVAVWAFREADRRRLGESTALVHLSDAAATEADGDPLRALASLGHAVLAEGVVNLSPSFAAGISRVRQQLEAAGMTWPATLVDDLAEQVEAYRSRSARYSPDQVARLLGETAARQRSAGRGGELPSGYILGLGEARETPLGHTRLVSLGVRVDGAGQEREAELYLADPDSNIVLVLRKEWRYAETEEPADGPRLGERALTTGLRLREAAAGQIVTRVAKRQASRLVRLSGARRGTMSVMPQDGDWSILPEGIVVHDFAAHAAALRERPPRWLRPRVLAESIHVVPVAEVAGSVYSPGQQAVAAVVRDRHGHDMLVQLRHRSVAPFALDALAAALAGGSLRFLSGALVLGRHGLEMEPVAAVTDRLVVLDIAPQASPPALPLGTAGGDGSPLAVALGDAWSCLVHAAHAGLIHTAAPWRERACAATEGLRVVGLAECAELTSRLADAVHALQLSPRHEGEGTTRAARAWDDAAVRIGLAVERVASGEATHGEDDVTGGQTS